MKERPINYCAPMVRAVLNDTKTQTRRIVKVSSNDGRHAIGGDWRFVSDRNTVTGAADYRDGRWCWQHVSNISRMLVESCPYGQPGDRLWVREDHHITLRDPRAVSVRYIADDSLCSEITIGEREFTMFQGRKRPLATTRGRFMWRCLSRIQLEITGVRVQRLNDINEADAIAEGIIAVPKVVPHSAQFWRDYRLSGDGTFCVSDPRDSYRTLWESINGPSSWDANPWVWVVEFRRVTS